MPHRDAQMLATQPRSSKQKSPPFPESPDIIPVIRNQKKEKEKEKGYYY